MKRWGKCVSMCLSKRENVCEYDELCRSKSGLTGLCRYYFSLCVFFLFFIHPFSSSSLFLFRRGTVCCTRGSTTPGTLWWCKPESNSGRLTCTHSHVHPRPDTHKLTVWFMFRASKQRRKADRIVLECQEQAYWLINRPPVRSLLLYSIVLYMLYYNILHYAIL